MEVTEWAAVGSEKKSCASNDKEKETAVHYEAGYVSAGVAAFGID